jgi:hypothetical protein
MVFSVSGYRTIMESKVFSNISLSEKYSRVCKGWNRINKKGTKIDRIMRVKIGKRRKTEVRGGLAELQRRGMKITNYSETNVRRERDND